MNGALHITVAGSTGLVGSALTTSLTGHGHRVLRLVRASVPANGEIAWLPSAGQLEPSALEGVNAVVHLGGANIGTERWSAERRKEIWRSRVDSTLLLARRMASLPEPPSAFLCASAVGYYGDGGQATLAESSPPGRGFLADLCQAWEEACEPARAAGIRVVNLRFGAVLSPHGGALAAMVPLFRAGLGGKLGDGRHYMAWIDLADAVRAVEHILEREGLRGPVNLTSPHPVTNAAFAAALGKALRRPTLLPAPKLALEVALGRDRAREMLLASQRAVPTVLQQSGFTWRYGALAACLEHQLGLP